MEVQLGALAPPVVGVEAWETYTALAEELPPPLGRSRVNLPAAPDEGKGRCLVLSLSVFRLERLNFFCESSLDTVDHLLGRIPGQLMPEVTSATAAARKESELAWAFRSFCHIDEVLAQHVLEVGWGLENLVDREAVGLASFGHEVLLSLLQYIIEVPSDGMTHGLCPGLLLLFLRFGSSAAPM